MARKPENTFRDSVHKHLPKDIHHEKMNNPYSSGTPDDWYSSVRDLWVEYKYLPSIPKRKIIKPYELLTPLQLEWINNRHAEGRTVAVCIGCPSGGVLLQHRTWTQDLTAEDFVNKLLSRKDLARQIALITTQT